MQTSVAPQDPVETEEDFFRLWSQHCADLPPFEMAVTGGILADRFAWIFASGYQGAIRHIFPGQVFDGWGAFAVSEDRSEHNPLPGVTWRSVDDSLVIDGSKTWVAASSVCSDIVFSAGSGGNRRFFRVARDHPNLTVETRPPGRVLPDLSQGSAHFTGVMLAPADEVDTSLVPGFGACEVLYIYAAFLASSWVRAETEREEIESLLEVAESIAGRSEVSRDHDDMAALDRGVQTLLQHMRENIFNNNELWRRDYKLIAMYAR